MAIELNRLGQTVEESNDQLKVIQNLQRLKELAGMELRLKPIMTIGLQ